MTGQIEYAKKQPVRCKWSRPSKRGLHKDEHAWNALIKSTEKALLAEIENWYEIAHAPSAAERQRAELHEKFTALARKWTRETERFSNLNKIVMHPAYLQIIALGPSVIPEILQQLSRGPDHWFFALRALTQGEDPATGTTTMKAAAEAWVSWGREHGYLDK